MKKVKKKTKRLRTFKAGIIIIILLVSIIISFSAPVSAREYAISFNSYIDIDYDISALNQTLEMDESIIVPITVIYWTNVVHIIPKILQPFLWQLQNRILFNESMPMQSINLEISNYSEWANIYLTSPVINTNITFEYEEPRQIMTNLVISPLVEAPAQSYRIDIRASCESKGRLKGVSYQESIEFSPSFMPTIQISPENPIRTVGPHASVVFNIEVENFGNKITRVTPKLLGLEDKWIPTINPQNYEIPPNSKNTFTFSIITPYDFGWHNEYGRFEIEFLSEVYPYQSGAATNTESIYLIVNNYGFSTTGFEFVLVIISLIVIILIIKRKRNRV